MDQVCEFTWDPLALSLAGKCLLLEVSLLSLEGCPPEAMQSLPFSCLVTTRGNESLLSVTRWSWL